jgi:drug/metabolite transporter (DMT)-like permease
MAFRPHRNDDDCIGRVTYYPRQLLRFSLRAVRLSIVPWLYLLEQIVAQRVIAGVLSWIGFLYAARILGLVTASFMPAMTPAVASLIALGITRESPTVLQWLLIALGTIGAALLMTSLHARRTVFTDT